MVIGILINTALDETDLTGMNYPMKDYNLTTESKIIDLFHRNATDVDDAFQSMFNVIMSICMGKGMSHAEFKAFLNDAIDHEEPAWKEVSTSIEAVNLMRAIK